LKNGNYETSLAESFLIKRNNIDTNFEISRLYQSKERNIVSNYWFTLRNASRNMTFLKDYIDVIESMGNTSSYEMASGLLEADIKFDDYFIKRLIVTELVTY